MRASTRPLTRSRLTREPLAVRPRVSARINPAAYAITAHLLAHWSVLSSCSSCPAWFNPQEDGMPLAALRYDRGAISDLLRLTATNSLRHVAILLVTRLATSGDLAERLVFVKQAQPRGYGDALYGAKDFVGDETFLHLVGDHLYLSRTEQSCARQLVEVARTENCSVSAVQQTRENRLPYFGAIGGRRLPQSSRLYEVTTVLEKPTPTLAEQELVMAGLRTGYYLCVFGMHVLTPVIMDLLREQLERASATDKVPLSPALAQLAKRERYLAMELEGTRYDIGVKYGLLIAQLAHCLSGRDRDLILTELVQLLADQPQGTRS